MARSHRSRYGRGYYRLDNPAPPEAPKRDEATQLGYDYMTGKKDIKDVVAYVNSRHWNKETERKIAQGAREAESSGVALKSRVQPEQNVDTVQAVNANKKRVNTKKVDVSKLAKNPNPYRPPEKKPVKNAPKGRTKLTEYDVKATKGGKTLREREAVGSARIRPTKGAIRGELHVRRQHFDIYNTNKHRYVKD